MSEMLQLPQCVVGDEHASIDRSVEAMLFNHSHLMMFLPAKPPLAMIYSKYVTKKTYLVLHVNSDEWVLFYTMQTVWNWLYTKHSTTFIVKQVPTPCFSTINSNTGWKLPEIWMDTWFPREIWIDIFTLFFQSQTTYTAYYDKSATCLNKSMLLWMANVVKETNKDFWFNPSFCLRPHACQRSGKCFCDLYLEKI